jgi:hypothetical protein
MNISIVTTQEEHYKYAQEICETIELSALLRGTGIAKRTPEYIQKKRDSRRRYCIDSRKFAGFVISKVGNMASLWSGLIVHPIIEILVWQKK